VFVFAFATCTAGFGVGVGVVGDTIMDVPVLESQQNSTTKKETK
jgi:hypothetical protein